MGSSGPTLVGRQAGLTASTVTSVSRIRLVAATYGLDVLIVALAVASAVGAAVRQDPYRPDRGPHLGFEMAAVAVMVLALLLRRRARFAAPATTWMLAAALSFMDGRLIAGSAPLSVTGMIAAVLLGNLPDPRQARAGLVVVAASATVVAYNDPTHSVDDLFLIPVLFSIGWLVGFALHERGEQAQAADRRAAQAERDREVAARVAVAEERGRIARELHDVVAHAVSVMVLQVGAVRHRMPASSAEDRDALRNVEAAGRTALAEMRRLLDAMRREGDDLELLPHPGLHDLAPLVDKVRPPVSTSGCGSTASPRTYRRPSTCPPTGSCRKASPTPSSTATPAMSTSTCTMTPASSPSRFATTVTVPAPPTGWATAWSASVNASRSTAATCPPAPPTPVVSYSGHGFLWTGGDRWPSGSW